jgi:hypothetical protein
MQTWPARVTNGRLLPSPALGSPPYPSQSAAVLPPPSDEPSVPPVPLPSHLKSAIGLPVIPASSTSLHHHLHHPDSCPGLRASHPIFSPVHVEFRRSQGKSPTTLGWRLGTGVLTPREGQTGIPHAGFVFLPKKCSHASVNFPQCSTHNIPNRRPGCGGQTTSQQPAQNPCRASGSKPWALQALSGTSEGGAWPAQPVGDAGEDREGHRR